MLIIVIRILFVFIKYDLLSCTTKEHFSGSLSCFVTIISCSWHKTLLVDINAILHFCLARHFKDMPDQSLLLIAVDLKLLLSCCHCCHMNLLQFRRKIFDCGFRRTSVRPCSTSICVWARITACRSIICMCQVYQKSSMHTLHTVLCINNMIKAKKFNCPKCHEAMALLKICLYSISYESIASTSSWFIIRTCRMILAFHLMWVSRYANIQYANVSIQSSANTFLQ